MTGDTLRRSTGDCKTRVKVFAHPASDLGPGHRWCVPFDACHEARCVCPACRNRETRKRTRRVSDVYRRIGQASGHLVGVLAMVLTLPPEVRTDDVEALGSLRRAARGVLRDWVAAVNGLELATRSRAGWTITGVDVWHPAGDEHPEAFLPHIHAQIPAVAWWRPAGDLDDRPTWRRLKFKVTEEQLRDFRRRWGKALVDAGWHPGHSLHGELRTDRCVVHYRWLSGGDSPKARSQFAHRVRYDFRHWPAWEGNWRKIIWWGYAAPAAQKKAGIEALEEENKPEPQDGESTICPKCGQTAEYSADIGRDPDKMGRRRTREKILGLVGAPGWVYETRHVRWYDAPPMKIGYLFR